MKQGANGLPDAERHRDLRRRAAGPVDLEFGPGGDLYYADFNGGTIRRIEYRHAPPPTCPKDQFQAQYFANKALAGAPTIARCETTIDNDWGRGRAGGGRTTSRCAGPAVRLQRRQYTFTARGRRHPRLGRRLVLIDKWIDQRRRRTARPGRSPPGRTRSRSSTTRTAAGRRQGQLDKRHDECAAAAGDRNAEREHAQWKVGDTISFSGSATDPEDGTLPASRLSWALVMQHCPSNCHSHLLQTSAASRAGRSARRTTSTRRISS